MDKILHLRTQSVACLVVSHAAQNQQLCILGKLFVLGTNPALQLTAGNALKETIFKILGKSEHNMEEIVGIEKVLRFGLNQKPFYSNILLVGLFAEIYKLTIFCISLAYKDRNVTERHQFHLSKEGLEIALRDFLKKCCQIHPSVSEHVHFQIEITLDVLKPDIWASKENDVVEDILQVMSFCTQANQAPQDRSAAEGTITKRLADKKICDTQRCLLLHYLASAIQSNQLNITVYHDLLYQELVKAEQKKSKKLLFSCAILCVEMCLFVSYAGMTSSTSAY